MSPEEPDWDFFVSYAPGDVAWAEWVAWQLEENGYHVLLEKWDNVPGTYWVATLDLCVRRAARMIALASPGYLRSGPHQLAWWAAVQSDRDGSRRKLIPIKIEHCDVVGLLGHATPIDLVGLEPDAARTRLLAQVKATGVGRAKPLVPPSHPGIGQPAGPRPVAAPPFPSARTGILAEVCDNLAREVERQWLAEAEHRRLHELGMLPVRWSPTDPELVKDWASLIHLASDGGAGWPTPAPETWASGPADLAGGPNDLVDVLRRVPTGRLVVLGEPGAGKTTLLQRLTLDLLSRRREEGGGLVPVLLPLSSWNPNKQPFYGWLESKLLDYAATRANSPDARRTARGLLDDRLLLLLLDGFDEIPDVSRGAALGKMRRALKPGQKFVLTSRSHQYRDAVRPVRGAEILLTGAAGVELCPLGREDIARYLRDASEGPRAARRWEPVVRALDESPPPPAVQALTTPLALTLAKTIYTPQPGDGRGSRPDPAELLDQDLFPDRRAVVGHLLERFVHTVYEPDTDGGQQGTWPAENVRLWLAFLAGHLKHTQGGSPDVAWWRLPAAAPRRIRSWLTLVGAFVVWSVFMAVILIVNAVSQIVHGDVGVPKFVQWPGIALPLGLLVWCAVVFGEGFSGRGGLCAWGSRLPAGAIRRPRHPRRVWVASGTGLAASVFLAVPAWLDKASIRDGLGEWVVPLAAAVVGLVVALTVGWLYGTTTTDAAVGVTASPSDTMAADKRVFQLLAARYGLASTLCLCLWIGALEYLRTEGQPGDVLGDSLFIAAALGLPFALGAGAGKTAWVPYAIVRRWLARRGDLPPNLTEFLADAHERRSVLRRVGAVYQFRHIELQRKLAGDADDPAAARLAAAVEEELRGRFASEPAFDLSWCAADSALIEPWTDLQQLAASWASSTSDSTGWALNADDLAGTGTSLAATFEKIPTRRLVVLGPEGTGKSTLLARLALDLLTRRRPGDPVPVLLPLRSWNPDRQGFAPWLEHEVRRRHTWLGAFSAEVTGARALLDTWKIMPLLDGLEDLPSDHRTAALIAIDNWLRDGAPVVVSADPEAFRGAVLPTLGEPAPLHGAAAIEILPIPLDVAEDILAGRPTRDLAASMWAPVLAEAASRPDSPVARALTTPLALSLARAVYCSRQGDPDADGVDPGELCDRTRFPFPDAIQNHLMERQLRRAYLPHTDNNEGCRTFESAERGLTHLAFHLETRLQANSIAWWEIQRTAPNALLAAPLMLAGVFYGIAGAANSGVLFSITIYPAAFFVFGLFLNNDRNVNIRTPRRYGHLRARPPTPHMRGGAVPARRTGPRALLRRSRRAALLVWPPLLAALCVLAFTYISFLADNTLPTSGRWWTAVIVGAVGLGFTGGVGLTAWGRFTLTQMWLARRHRLPTDLIAFLEDAQERGVLRQTGDVWEFHHPTLQRHLAASRQERDPI